jgi:hypothetical protein
MPMNLLIAAFVLALPVLAQQEGQLSLGGTVVNGKTGEPIRRALVTAIRFGPARDDIQGQGIQRQGGEPGLFAHFSRTVFTDAGGVFHFVGLPAGQYTVTARKPEFTVDFSGRPAVRVDLSSSTDGFSVKLSPSASLPGRLPIRTAFL